MTDDNERVKPSINKVARERLIRISRRLERPTTDHDHIDAADDIDDLLQEAEDTEQAGAVPDGWQLVPVEPTDEMKKACDETPGPMTAWKAWHVMRAAAPKTGET